METSRTVSIGLAVGLAVAAGLMRLLSGSNSILPDFSARPFLGAAIVLVAAALAALVPLRGVARIDPAQALRAE